MPGTIAANGNVLYSWMIAPSITPASVNANTTSEQAFTIPGLQVSDFVDVYFWGPNNVTPGPQTVGIGIVNNRVSAANVLQIGFMNNTGGSLTPAAGIYLTCISRPEVAISLLAVNAA